MESRLCEFILEIHSDFLPLCFNRGGRVLGRSYAGRLKATTTNAATPVPPTVTSTPRNNQRMENQHQQFQSLLHPSVTAFHENSLTNPRSSTSTPVMLMPHVVNAASTNPLIVSMTTSNTTTSTSPVVFMDGAEGDNLS